MRAPTGEVADVEATMVDLFRRNGAVLLGPDAQTWQGPVEPPPAPPPSLGQATGIRAATPMERIIGPARDALQRGWEWWRTPVVDVPQFDIPADDMETQGRRMIEQPGGLTPFYAMASLGKRGANIGSDLAESMTTPENIALTAASGGGTLAGKAGLMGISRGARLAEAAMSAPIVYEGARNVAEADTAGGKLAGAIQAGLGAHGIKTALSTEGFVPVRYGKDAKFQREVAANSAGESLTQTPPALLLQRRSGDRVYYGLTPRPDGGIEAGALMNNQPGYRGAIKEAMPDLTARGATNADAWAVKSKKYPEGMLPTLYKREGWQVVETQPYDVAAYGEPNEALKASWRTQGWRDGDPIPDVVYMRRPEGHGRSGNTSATPAGIPDARGGAGASSPTQGSPSPQSSTGLSTPLAVASPVAAQMIPDDPESEWDDAARAALNIGGLAALGTAAVKLTKAQKAAIAKRKAAMTMKGLGESGGGYLAEKAAKAEVSAAKRAAKEAAYEAKLTARAEKHSAIDEEFTAAIKAGASPADLRDISTRRARVSHGLPDPEPVQLKVGDRTVNVIPSVLDQRRGNVVVPVKMAAFDAAWQGDKGFHVGPGGAGGIGNRYEQVGEFLQTAKTMEAPEVHVRENGTVIFGDGRHRAAYLRDQGVENVPVSMDAESLANAQKHGLIALPKAKAQKAVSAANRASEATLSHLERSPIDIDEQGHMYVSNAVPTSVKGQVMADAPLSVGMEQVKKDPELLKKYADTIRGYDILTHAQAAGSDEEVLEHFIETTSMNVGRMIDEMEEGGWAPLSRQWYDGAHKVIKSVSSLFGVDANQSAGVFAVLSPQKDWHQNAEMAKRVIAARQRFLKENPKFDKEVFDRYRLTSTNALEDGLKAKVKKGDMSKAGMNRVMNEHPGILDQFGRQVKDKHWQDMTPQERAVFLRAHDEITNGQKYPILSPDGQVAHAVAKTDTGDDAMMAWQSYAQIEKALAILDDPSPENISKLLGDEHKVRAFFNNMSRPNYGRLPGEIGPGTVDTHQVAVSLLKPLGASADEVKYTMGGAGNSQLGLSGLNPVYQDTLRQTVAGRSGNYLPREGQSVSWDGIKTLFSPEQKRDEKFVEKINGLWREYRNGRLSLRQVQDAVITEAKGIKPPEWAARK